MSLLSRLKTSLSTRAKSLIGGALNWAGVSWSGDVISSLSTGGGRNAEGYLRAFKTCQQLRAPVNRISKDWAAVKFHLKRRIPGAVGINGKPPCEVIHEGNATPLEARILRLLKQPNYRMTGTQFRWLLNVYLETVGYAPIAIEWEAVAVDGVKMRLPRALKPIAPHRVVALPDQGKPYFRVMGAKGKTIDYPIDDIIWLSHLDVLDPYGMGAGAAQAVDDEVSQLAYADTWNNNFYRQGAHHGTVVGLDGVSPDTKKQIEQTWESRYTGIHNAHRTLFVDGKVSVSNSSSHKEQDFVSTQQHLGDRIRFNYQMPPELVGDVRNSNRATIQGATQVHQQGNLAPACVFFEEHFNLFLMPLFGDPDLYLEWVDPVQKTEELMHQALTDGLNSGAVSRDEWRMGHHMDPWGSPWGNTITTPMNLASQSLDSTPEEEAAHAAISAAATAAAKAAQRRAEGDRREEFLRNGPRVNGRH